MSLPPIERRLAFRILAPLALFTFLLALCALGVALYAVSEFVGTQAANDLRWRALGITQIMETGYDELQRSGKSSDEAAVRARKVIAMLTAEDFARVNRLHLRIEDAVERRVDQIGMELPAAGSAPLIQRWLGIGERATTQILHFRPWQWTVTLTQDMRAYHELFQKLLLLMCVAAAVFVAGFAALTLWLTATLQRPVRHIVADVEQGRPPQYTGIAEFEFLSRSVATMMRSSQQAQTERQARLVAESANLAKSLFLAAMSHELRTPLNAIMGFTQVLQLATNLTPRQREQLTTIHESGEHLLTLIEDVLDLAKIEAGKLALETSLVDTDAFLRKTAEVCRIRAHAGSIAFVLEVVPGLPSRVRIDERRVRQVLLNLVGNGVKFTERGQVSLRVQQVAHAGALARLRFEVRDTGIGIPAEQQEAIFRPFEQAGDVEQRAKGTGLGLAISRQLVQLMGGDIHVVSAPGEGSLFAFEIDVPAPAPEVAAAAPRAVPVGYDGPRRKVLVVDDAAENRAFLTDVLRRFDFTVLEAADGSAGLAAAQASRPDLILMDSVMPGMDGIEATRRLRAQAVFRDVPIVTISAGTFKDDAARSLEAGASGFLTKPLRLDLLVNEIESQLKLTWVYP